MDTVTTSYQIRPYCCPVCNGRGTVPRGFYSSTTATIPATSTQPEQCKSYFGRGIVFS